MKVLHLFTFLCLICTMLGNRSNRNTGPYYGIPVPGITVSALEVFRLFSNTCRPRTTTDKHHNIFYQISKLLSNHQADEMAQDIYSSLYFAIGDVDIQPLMGKWHTVVDSTDVHLEECIVIYFQALFETPYTATFSTKQYFRIDDSMESIDGYGSKVGPDPGQLLISIEHPSDPCPYSPVKLGPLNDKNEYDYVILSQFLKYPTMVLARDPQDFEKKHRKLVEQFLNKYDFRKHNDSLKFVNFTECPFNDYFSDISTGN